jgi:hypothetical protein
MALLYLHRAFFCIVSSILCLQKYSASYAISNDVLYSCAEISGKAML